MEFVAYVGTDKENWGQITALMNRLEGESVLVMSKQVSGFPVNDRCTVINVDPTKPLVEFKEDIVNKLKRRVVTIQGGKISSDRANAGYKV